MEAGLFSGQIGGTSGDEGSDVSLVLSGARCGDPMAGHGSEVLG